MALNPKINKGILKIKYKDQYKTLYTIQTVLLDIDGRPNLSINVYAKLAIP
jgi:hypothetical protein